MLAQARRRDSRIDWVQGDIAAFAPATPPDLIFTNAALQWVDDHQTLIPRLAGLLAPRGVFACQIPAVDQAPFRVAVAEIAGHGPWAASLAAVAPRSPTAEPSDYYAWLAPLCAEVDIWTTTYLHALEGEAPVLDWISGAALRPYLDALEGDPDREGFLTAVRQRLAQDYPARPDGVTLLPFKRLFVLARRP